MPEEKENEANLIAVLSRKIDDQTKFIYMLVVVCCLSILACMFYSLTQTVSVLPDLVYDKLLGNLESLQHQWRVLDKSSH